MDTDFCDIILDCEDKKFKTHRTIIPSCSPVLKFEYTDLFEGGSTLRIFTICQPYQGVVGVAARYLSSFLEVAEDLQIRDPSEANPDR